MFMGVAIPFTGFITKVALYGMLIGPLIPLISYLQRNKRLPSYGVNKDGFLLNERGWDGAFFTWDEIKDLKEFDHPRIGKEFHFEFVSFTKALNKPGQDKFAQALNREYVTQKQPKKISPELVKGDLTEFMSKFKQYYQEYKAENPISAVEAYEIAMAHFKDHNLNVRIKSADARKEDHIEGLEGAFFVIPLIEKPEMEVLVSIDKLRVEGIRKDGRLDVSSE
jgi:hypothetical protein